MDTGKRARIARIAGFTCLFLALLNAALAIWAIVDENNFHSGSRGLMVAGSMLVIGMVNLHRANRKTPPDA
jgi:hypothetical protein